jgi:hypothetical protein
MHIHLNTSINKLHNSKYPMISAVLSGALRAIQPLAFGKGGDTKAVPAHASVDQCQLRIIPRRQIRQILQKLGPCAHAAAGDGRRPIPIDISPRTMGKDPSSVYLRLRCWAGLPGGDQLRSPVGRQSKRGAPTGRARYRYARDVAVVGQRRRDRGR